MTENNNTNIPPQPQVRIFIFRLLLVECVSGWLVQNIASLTGYMVLELTKQPLHCGVASGLGKKYCTHHDRAPKVEVWPKMWQHEKMLKNKNLSEINTKKICTYQRQLLNVFSIIFVIFSEVLSLHYGVCHLERVYRLSWERRSDVERAETVYAGAQVLPGAHSGA